MEGIDVSPANKRPGFEDIYEWVTTVDHKKIGLMYIAYALIFLVNW
jgi:cytochrome c oxidase subunit 1